MEKLTFSGHETFYCRALWLPKGYNFIKEGKQFNQESSVADLGVGRNMVSSMKFWLEAFNICDPNQELTQFAHFIFGPEGVDLYLEDPVTLWLLHYYLVTINRASIYHLVFNEFRKERIEFNDSHLERYIWRKLAELNQTYSPKTIESDIAVFRRTYIRSKNTKQLKAAAQNNEPVERLLHIASLFLKNESSCVSSKNHEKLLEVIKRSYLFPFDNQLIDQLAWQLFPMDIISAAVLTLALQKYGQNERSLFSFLKSNEYLGIKNFNRDENPYFNLGCVYDYLLNNYYSFLSTKYNPDYLQWTAINSALERSEAILNERYNDAAKIIKVIGLLNIFGYKGGKINPGFLLEYSQISMDIQDPKSIIENLEELKIIRYREFKQSYILFDGTDLDIGMEINRAESAIDFPVDLTPMLNQYFHFPYILDELKLELFKEYQQIAGQDKEVPVTNLDFVETIKPFFMLYRGLPKYTRQTKRLSPTALKLREAIETAKFPEKTFFEDFPRSMGFSLQDLNESPKKLEVFSQTLNNALKEIHDSFAQLLNRIEEFILDETGLTGLPYEEYKKNLTRRYQGIKKYLMLPHQKSFHSRLISKIDDQRKSANSNE